MRTSVTPCLFKEQPSGPPPGSDHDMSEHEDNHATHRKGALHCKSCRTKISRHDLSMRIGGKHLHVFFNPHGLVFEIGCFESAKNIMANGNPTEEFTWFPGYAWQALTCTGCSTMLGWRYAGNDHGFYGLILSALTDVSSND